MEGIKDKVAIVGMGCTKFGELWDKSVDDLIIDATYEAYEDAGIEPKNIQAAWIGTAGSAEIGTIVNAPLKLPYSPVTRVENRCASGTDCLRNAAYGVASGAYDIVLAVGVEKVKDVFPFLATTLGYNIYTPHPVWEYKVGASALFSLTAVRYFYHYGLSFEEGKRLMGMIAVKNHYNGSLNPRAHLRREVALEQVINAPFIFYPFGLFDCCGNSDGAAAAILCRADMAKSFRQDPVMIKGISISCSPGERFGSVDYDMLHFEETVAAAKAAYQEAGIKNPRQEIDLAEVHDCFTITELVTYEDLGFSPRGRAKEDILAGTFTLKGDLPVNSDGGLKSFGHPIGASGLRMVYELYRQFQGKAEFPARQLKNPRLGVTHNLGSGGGGHVRGGATVSVAVLGL